MSKNRIIAIFSVLAAVSAILTSLLVYRYLSPARGTIYVFNDDYSTGMQVTKDMLSPMQVDSTIITSGARGSIEDQFVSSEDYRTIISAGDTLKMDVAKGMPLTQAMLSMIGGSSLEMNMKPTSVAVTIPVTNITGVSNEIASGSRVNVYMASTASDLQEVDLVLQNMKVLAVYKEDGELSGVSLEVTPEQSLQLVYAENYGNIYLGIIDAGGYQSVEEDESLHYSQEPVYNMDDDVQYQALLDSFTDDGDGSTSTVVEDETESLADDISTTDIDIQAADQAS